MRTIEEVVEEIERHAEYRNCDPTYLFENYDVENALDEILEIHKAKLDKIRAEIDKARFVDKYTRICKNALASGLEVAMEIINKYKAESEDRYV